MPLLFLLQYYNFTFYTVVLCFFLIQKLCLANCEYQTQTERKPSTAEMAAQLMKAINSMEKLSTVIQHNKKN